MIDEKSFYAVVGQKVKEAREKRGITQEELATDISLSRTSVTNIEKGRQKFMLHTLVEIAIVLSVPPSSLFPEIDMQLGHSLDEKIKSLSPSKRRWIKNTIEGDSKSRS